MCVRDRQLHLYKTNLIIEIDVRFSLNSPFRIELFQFQNLHIELCAQTHLITPDIPVKRFSRNLLSC